MKLDIKDGKADGWLTTAETTFALGTNQANVLRMAKKGVFSEKDHIMLYGKHLFRKSAVEKLKKKI